MLQFARRVAALVPSIKYLGLTRGSAPADVLPLDHLADRYEAAIALSKTQPFQPSAADVIMFQLSGGSTGSPKIIPRMQGEYLAQAAAVAQRYELTTEDVCLWTLPLIHNAGMLLIVVPTVIQRRTAVIHPRFELQDFLRLIGRCQVTFSGSVGPIAPRLLELKDIRRYDLQSLRQFFCMSRADAMEAHAGVKCINQYGITEGLILASAPSDSSQARHATNGWPTGVLDEIKLLHLGSECAVMPGESGELCFRGASCFTGYFNEPDSGPTTLTADGFFRTGDLMKEVRLGGRSYFLFEGRLSDNINRGGEKIGAEELERLLSGYPGISDVRVTAMPDRIYGEKVCAFVIVRPGCKIPTVAEIGEYLLGLGLAKYKLPERIEPVVEFPLTSVGKVDKAKLRALIAEMVSADMSARMGCSASLPIGVGDRS
jgi:non-ribosomal peptide synthetase component E (peptide arylation enzyme)